MRGLAASACLMLAAPAVAQDPDAAARFGARELIISIALSPDGTQIAYAAPRAGQGAAVYTVDLASKKPKLVTTIDGKPLRLRWCRWVSNARLVCSLFQQVKAADEIISLSRLIAVNADGTKLAMVSQKQGENAHYLARFGGGVIDWLPGTDNAVLTTQWRVPETKTGTMIGKSEEGLAVARVDTLNGRANNVEAARPDAVEYITDGRGNVRVMGVQARNPDGFTRSKVTYHYRRPGSRDWAQLSNYDVLNRDGFNPYAVDPERNLAYGLEKRDGRLALYSVALDGSAQKNLVFEHSEVDVDGVVQIGRNQRVVGATYATDKRQTHYFEKDIAAMAASLSKALPNLPQTHVIDASLDGQTLLIWAGSDVDPGNYYVFDRRAKTLNMILLARPELEGVKLAPVKAITYRASDGTAIPAYLTLPAGSSGKDLPAIVLPHGGPAARDEWGFDWLAQFFAHQGYAVLQPNFRGSQGYGDAWFAQNGFKSWRVAVGDIVDAGRHLVAQGIADPAKLGILGWSYGGYAALQSGVIAPDLFKGIVAIAPVTDFGMTISEQRQYTNYYLVRQEVGIGPHLREGSPLQNVNAIKAPVLLLHGDMDTNVDVRQARVMADKLKDAGKQHELIVFNGLDHYLGDSAVRADLLRKSDAWLKAAMAK